MYSFFYIFFFFLNFSIFSNLYTRLDLAKFSFVCRYDNLRYSTVKLTSAKLIGSREDYNKKREQFRICENILHSRRPFDIPAIYKSENTCNINVNNVVNNRAIRMYIYILFIKIWQICDRFCN